jgi:hypothetical protein
MDMVTKTSNFTFVSFQKDVHDASCQDIGFSPLPIFKQKLESPISFLVLHVKSLLHLEHINFKNVVHNGH